MAFSPIRVFLVDDSPVALTLLKRMLATSPDIEVVGTARNGKEALELFPQVRPKVICTDLHMPIMDGLALIRETMVTYPRPILVISSTVNPEERDKTYSLLEAGAVDVFPKPSGSEAFEENARLLVQKIRILAGVFVVSRRPQEPGPIKVRPVSEPTPALSFINTLRGLRAPKTTFRLARNKGIRIVGIGSSTGGPQVLKAILTQIPASFPCPIVCVQHISRGFLSGMVDWINAQSSLRVKIAESGETARPGTVYFPSEDKHLEMDAKDHLILSSTPPVDGHRPSVTTTFQSLAQHYGDAAMSVLLTGMGGDGAVGMLGVAKAGGVTVAQDEASCVVYGMPKQAVELGAAQFLLPPDEIAKALLAVASLKG